MNVLYTARFLRSYTKLPLDIQSDIANAIELFTKNPKDLKLKLHKLKGKLKPYHSFSANYSHRIILKIEKGVAYCMDVGGHSIYE